VSGCTPPNSRLELKPPLLAATRPGTACANAAGTRSMSLGCRSVLPPTDGPGWRTLTTEPAERWAQAGASTVVLFPVGADAEQQYARFAAEVLPLLGSGSA
jgi:hypothetical protein